MRIVGMAIERELQDARSRQMEFVAQRAHVRRDDPEVLRQEGKTAQGLLQGWEEVSARARLPLTGLRGRRSERNVPGSGEAAEVIEADRVDVREQGAHPVDAEAITARAKRVPVVDRIAPALPLRAEVVWRHAGDDARPARLVEQEQLRIRPHVARVRRNEEGQVADQADAFRARAIFQARALAEQHELAESNGLDGPRKLAARPIERA